MWATLWNCTKDLRGPWLFSPSCQFPIGFGEVSSILCGARRAPGSVKLNYFRGYVAGREDYDLARRFLEGEQLGRDNIASTILNAFARQGGPYGERAGLIVNGGLQWSHEVHDQLAPHAAEIYALKPASLAIDLTLFIGAYGATPFGAHIDDSTHRTIIFNLGPGAKDIRIWCRQSVEAQLGFVRNVDPSMIGTDPQTFSILRGSAFVLPSDEFHIAYNNEVSTTANLVVDYVQDNRLAERELSYHGTRIDTGGHDESFNKLTVERLVDMGRKRLRSNGFLRYSPPQEETQMAQLKRETIIASDSRRPLLIEKVGPCDIVYSRGSHFYGQRAATAIEAFVRLGRLKLEDFLAIAQRDGAELNSSLRLVKFLLNSRGATVA